MKSTYNNMIKIITDFFKEEESYTQHEIAFDKWWNDEASGIKPIENHDQEEHTKRIAKIAWLNGVFKERMFNE